MKEKYDEINGMIDMTVKLLPKKKSDSYKVGAIVTAGSLTTLINTTTIYKNEGKMTESECQKLQKKISRKIDRL